ncbi:MAG: O-antigen ligase family protein [Actinomycetota bacterium]|nr:O-antigen ligase family protein [Actinomycetota bacterium]
MLNEKKAILYNSIRKFLIFTAFYLVLFFYRKIIIFDKPYVLVITELIFLAIYLISVFRIKIGFYIFIFLFPLLPAISNMYSVRRMNVISLFFMALFLGFLVNRFKSDEGFVYEIEIAKPVFVFIIILTLSSIITIFRYSNLYPFITTKFHGDILVNFAGDTSSGAILWTLKYYFNYVSGFVLLFITFNVIKERRDFITSLVVMLSTCPVVIAVGLYQYFINPYFGTSTFWIEAGRINSTMNDPNALGGYIILMFPLFISLIIYLKKWYLKVAAGLFLAVFTYFSFLCGSRSAFAGIAFTVALFVIIGLSMALRHLIKKKVSSPDKSILISATTIVVLFIIIFSATIGIMVENEVFDNIDKFDGTGIILLDRMVETVGDFYTSLKSEGLVDAVRDISSGREILWRQAFYMFRDHPVSGVGHAAYFIELSDYHRRYHRGFHILDFVGNYYLQILSELGLVGFILVLFIFFLIIKKPVMYFLDKNKKGKLKRDDWLLAGLLISFLSMAVAYLFGPHTNFIEVQFLFWLVIGLIFAYININSENINIKSEINNQEESEQKRSRWNRYFYAGNFRHIRFDLVSRIALIFIILIFGITLLISSVTDLSINTKQVLYKWENYYGFYDEEFIDGRIIRWTSIDAIQVLEKNGNRLIVPVKDGDPAGHLLPLFIRFYVNNRLVEIVKITDKEWHNIEIDLSDYDHGRFVFTMACSRSWVPKERGLSNDTREIGVMTGKFIFLE